MKRCKNAIMREREGPVAVATTRELFVASIKLFTIEEEEEEEEATVSFYFCES